jgi:LDH2 family malate/lactate/ureidoglycolate dehydrogenase
MVGTNPIAIAIPGDPHPLVLDMATSVVSMGRVIAAAAAGNPIPSGWALDAEGNSTTDPAKAREGSIAPFGGAKGYALGLSIEVMIAALTGAALGKDITGTLDEETVCNKGDVFIVIDVSDTLDAPTRRAIGAYLGAIRETPRQPGSDAVLVPGDRARRNRSERLAYGMQMDCRIWDQANALRNQLLGARS